MKPLSELVKAFEDNWGAHADDECSECMAARQITEKLQAWLREADKVLDEAERNPSVVQLGWVRHKLLGTTRTEGKK